MDLPEWANLVRLTTDELVLVAYYRACHVPEVKESVYEFARVSAESCRSLLPGGNVIALQPRKRNNP